MPILAKHMNLEKKSKEDQRKSIYFWYEVQKRSELTNIVKYTLSKFQSIFDLILLIIH